MINGFFERCVLTNYDRSVFIEENIMKKAGMNIECDPKEDDNFAIFQGKSIVLSPYRKAWSFCQSYE